MNFYYYVYPVIFVYILSLPISAQTTTTPVPYCPECTYWTVWYLDRTGMLTWNIVFGFFLALFSFGLGVLFGPKVTSAWSSWRNRRVEPEAPAAAQPLLFSSDKRMIFADIER